MKEVESIITGNSPVHQDGDHDDKDGQAAAGDEGGTHRPERGGCIFNRNKAA